MTQHPCVDQGNSGPGPSTVKPGTPCAKQPALNASGKAACAATFKATNCDSRTRTINRGASCGGADDYWYYSPWRAPGDAPVFDACGLAGGNHESNPTCGYDSSKNAKLGDRGSQLKPTAPGAVWKVGSTVEVGWSLQANHGPSVLTLRFTLLPGPELDPPSLARPRHHVDASWCFRGGQSQGAGCAVLTRRNSNWRASPASVPQCEQEAATLIGCASPAPASTKIASSARLSISSDVLPSGGTAKAGSSTSSMRWR